jgi:hypothetical protein
LIHKETNKSGKDGFSEGNNTWHDSIQYNMCTMFDASTEKQVNAITLGGNIPRKSLSKKNERSRKYFH